jgi:hypothetical protein
LPPLKFKAGPDNNVLLPFIDIAECLTYGQLIQDSSVPVKNPCLQKKYKMISERLTDAIEKQRLAGQVHGHSFRVVGSQITWTFSSGNTLSVSGPVLNKVRYTINERNSYLFLDLDPKLISENLRIQVRRDDQIELVSEFSGNVEFVLMPVN